MTRRLLAVVALVVAGGPACQCSSRPDVRDLTVIGAPALGVGSSQELPPAPAQPDLKRFTAVGHIAQRGGGKVTLQPKQGNSVVLDVGSRTSITSSGRVVDVLSLPEGAEVRASWTERKDASLVADHIDVVELHPKREGAMPIGRRKTR